MTSHERFSRMFAHRDADRIPIRDHPWRSTIERWQCEGLPKDVNYVDFLDLDHVEGVQADVSPRYDVKTLEETDEYKIYTTCWGVTMRSWKHAASTPEFIDFTIKDRDSWAKAKARMSPARDRIDWARLKAGYPVWREKGYWLVGEWFFGFDATHSWIVGTERVLMALVEDPEWCVEMFNAVLDMCIAQFEMIWEAGYRVDAIHWCDDMGYKKNQFFSMKTYRELLKPVHKRAIEWAHSKGIKAYLHSCGDINPFVPELIGIGLDALNPLEVKAGMDPVQLKKKYGDKLVFHGGINAVLWDDREAIEAEMRRVLPAMKERGGYIFGSDHSVPSSVSFDDFRRIVALAKQLGAY